MKRIAPLGIVLAVIGLLLTGCAGYRLGTPSARKSISSIYIAPVQNRSEAPQVRALMASSLRDVFVEEGVVNLASQDHAAATLEIKIEDYSRRRGASTQEDSERALSFETSLTAMVRVVDASSGEVLISDFTVTSNGISLAHPSSVDSEYQSLPSLVNDLAHRIHDRIAYSW